MQSSKNILVTGIVLIITLFTSFQINAMEQQADPYLSAEDREWRQEEKENVEWYEECCDPKSEFFQKNSDTRGKSQREMDKHKGNLDTFDQKQYEKNTQ